MLTTLIILLALTGLAVSSVTYWVFWRRTAGTGHWEMIRRETGGRPWLWLGAGFLSSLGSQAWAVILYPLFLVKRAWLRPRRGRNAAPSGPPVLFVHGYTHTASAWILFARWFRRAGYTDLDATTYNSWTLDFEGIVRQVEDEVRGILARRPGQKLVLVGHSLGGLAVRALLNSSDLAPHILAVVTLGSPHQGTVLAPLGMNKLGHTLAFQGPLVREIEAKDRDTGVPSLAVFSPVDNMIVPLEGLRIHAPGWEELRIGPVCHVGMLYHRPTAQAALEFIDRARNARD